MVDDAGAARNGRKSDLTLDARLSLTLIREIIANRYPPGARLREQEIAARHGVSRASVREALRNVAYAGFVEIEPWRGAKVAEVSRSELLDIFSLLEETYGRCAYWAAERCPESAFARLDEMMADLEDAVRRGLSQAEKDNRSFAIGQFIGSNAGSDLAYRMLVQVGNLAIWQQRLLLENAPHVEVQSRSAHHLMISAIKAREPEIAEAGARMIVMITRRQLEVGTAPRTARTKPDNRRKKAASPPA
jgi:DNA-binding GntR family transcriptional regulator